MITRGQARRIAAEWQGPGNECSRLQHTGVISDDLGAELADNVAATRRQKGYDEEERALAVCELKALYAFAAQHGAGKVEGWGPWDDTPVSA